MVRKVLLLFLLVPIVAWWIYNALSGVDFILSPAQLKQIDKRACPATVSVFNLLLRSPFGRHVAFLMMMPVCLQQGHSVEVCTSYCQTYTRHSLEALRRIFTNKKKVCEGTILAQDPWAIQSSLLDHAPATAARSPPQWPVVPANTDPQNASKVYRILHITDVHIDLRYSEGSNSNCRLLMCCHVDSPPVGNTADRAGKFGEYKCDTPSALLESFLGYMKDNIKFDAIYFTGDISPHDDDVSSIETKKANTKYFFQKLREYFPDTVVLPVIGNHDAFPLSLFPAPEEEHLVPSAWIYEMWAAESSQWLDEAARASFRRCGYYTVRLHRQLRVVVLNSNFCDTTNFLMLLNNRDPCGQLLWLIGVLSDAEANSEKVHILMHHSVTREDCYSMWSNAFNAVRSRFSRTVVAVFCGHKHRHTYNVLLDHATRTIPETVLYLGPSLTPYHVGNPSFVVYQVDDSEETDHVVVDYEMHVLQLKTSNGKKSPVFESLPSIKDYYGMTNLSPTQWQNLTSRMETDDKLFANFFLSYNHLSSEHMRIHRNKLLCLTSATRPEEAKLC